MTAEEARRQMRQLLKAMDDPLDFDDPSIDDDPEADAHDLHTAEEYAALSPERRAIAEMRQKMQEWGLNDDEVDDDAADDPEDEGGIAAEAERREQRALREMTQQFQEFQDGDVEEEDMGFLDDDEAEDGIDDDAAAEADMKVIEDLVDQGRVAPEFAEDNTQDPGRGEKAARAAIRAKLDEWGIDNTGPGNEF